MRLEGITEMNPSFIGERQRERERAKKELPFKELSKDGFETRWTSCVCTFTRD